MKLHIGGRERKQGWTILNTLSSPEVDVVGDIRDLSGFPDVNSFGVFQDTSELRLFGFPVSLNMIGVE
jgi:predicted SAM-dependent methyltransferase